ncbi:MAG: hypothetical protein ACFFD4_26090 [Candidatus Odinarchaeota archaeon]
MDTHATNPRLMPCPHKPLKPRVAYTKPYMVPLLVLILVSIPFLLVPGGEDGPEVPISAGGISGKSGSEYIAKEKVTDLVQTADGGFALVITTEFDLTGDSDIMLVKTGTDGTVEWSKTFGQSRFDRAGALVQTVDGGYTLAGSTWREDSTFLWLIKTDANGKVEWNETYENIHVDSLYIGKGLKNTFEGISSIFQTREGGFALALDSLLVKIDTNGALEWTKTYTSPKRFDDIFSLVQTEDGGFALAGRTSDGPSTSTDMWLVKTDSTGAMEWSKTYGRANHDDQAYSLVQTEDGGFALAGSTNSYEGYRSDMLLVKTDGNGAMEWGKTYGGAKHDEAQSLIQTGDGGFVLAGLVDYDHSRSDSDTWLVKTDSNGDVEWNNTYGGPDYDSAETVIQATDGSFVIAGFTDVNEALIGDGTDTWLMKTDESGNELWKYFIDGTDDEEWVNDLIETVDGGFVFTGPSGPSHGKKMDA